MAHAQSSLRLNRFTYFNVVKGKVKEGIVKFDLLPRKQIKGEKRRPWKWCFAGPIEWGVLAIQGKSLESQHSDAVFEYVCSYNHLEPYHTSFESYLQPFLLRVYHVRDPFNNMKYCPISMVAISNDSFTHDPINYFNGALIFSLKFAVLWLIFLEHMFIGTKDSTLTYAG